MTLSAFPQALDNIPSDKTDDTPDAGIHAPHHNWLADAINAVQRVLKRLLDNAPRRNLLDYPGVDRTGVSDSTAGILLALADTPDGGCLEVPWGVYKVSSAITNTKNAIRIVGVGGPSYNESSPYFGSTFVCATQSITGFTFGSGGFLMHSGVTLENLNFIEASGGTRTSKLVQIRQQNHWTVRNCSFRAGLVGLEIDGSRTDGTQIDASWGKIDQCVFNQNTTNVNSVKSYGWTLTGGDCQSLSSGGTGIALDAGTQHVKIMAAKFDSGGAIVNNGMHNRVIACDFESDGTSTAILRCGATSVRSVVVGCSFTGKAGHSALVGIQVDSGAADSSLIGNTYSNINTNWTNAGTFFFNADSQKPSVTGAKGGNAALTSLLSTLAANGVITDNTS